MTTVGGVLFVVILNQQLYNDSRCRHLLTAVDEYMVHGDLKSANVRCHKKERLATVDIYIVLGNFKPINAQ